MSDEARDRALEQLSTHVELFPEMHKALAELRDQVAALAQPAQMQAIRLTQTTPIVRGEARPVAASIGLLNPTGITVYLGIGGTRPQPSSEAPSVPARSLVVLPVSANDVDVGALATDLAAGDAIVFLFRFETVQPAFLGGV